MLEKPNGEVQKLKLKNKSVLKVLNDKKTEIENFLKKEKIDIAKENDLIEVIKYYDSLN
jgi:hypothetical protein